MVEKSHPQLRKRANRFLAYAAEIKGLEVKAVKESLAEIAGAYAIPFEARWLNPRKRKDAVVELAERVFSVTAIEVPPNYLTPSARNRPERPPSIVLQSGRSAPAKDARYEDFYRSWEWKRARYDVLKARGRTCECCGSDRSSGARIVVDHIKPIRKYWDLRLDQANLQDLCDDCNMGKGSRDETDWRS